MRHHMTSEVHYIDQSLCTEPTMHPVEQRLREHLAELEAGLRQAKESGLNGAIVCNAEADLFFCRRTLLWFQESNTEGS